MEQEKRGRGRPKMDTHITEYGAPSRRQAINAMYMFEGVHLLSVAATDIPDSDLLWHSDEETRTAKSKNGILEQLGRMLEQDHIAEGDCIYVANLSIVALKNGKTSREIEKAIRAIRLTLKEYKKDLEDDCLKYRMNKAIAELHEMGGAYNEHP